MITTVVRSEETEIDIKKAIKTSLLMTFFLVAIPINSIMLTQAIYFYLTGNSGGFWGAATYFWSNVFPIMYEWGSIIAANGGSIADIIAGAVVGAAMSDPVTLLILGGITATA